MFVFPRRSVSHPPSAHWNGLRVLVCAAIFAAGCGGAQPGAKCSETDSKGISKAEAAIKPTSRKPPITGTFALTSVSDGGKTIKSSDIIKGVGGAGAFYIDFREDSIILGAWSVAQEVDKDLPGRKLYSFCRGRVGMAPAWDGSTMILDSDIIVDGISDAIHIEKHTVEKTTKKDTWYSSRGCSFAIGAGRHEIKATASDASGPLRLTLMSDKGTMELERTDPIEDLDMLGIIESTFGP